MTTTVWTNRLEPSSVAGKALEAATGLWFLVAVIGPCAFLYCIVAFYGPSIRRGGWSLGARGSHERRNIQLHDARVAVLSEALDDPANCTSVAALQDQDCRKANF
jgi:hypothetical protein